MALNEENLAAEEAEEARSRLAEELDIPVVLPLHEDIGGLAKIIKDRIGPERVP